MFDLLKEFGKSYFTYSMKLKVLVAQSYLTLCDLMDCGLPVSSAHGALQSKNTGVGSHSLQ